MWRPQRGALYLPDVISTRGRDLVFSRFVLMVIKKFFGVHRLMKQPKGAMLKRMPPLIVGCLRVLSIIQALMFGLYADA